MKGWEWLCLWYLYPQAFDNKTASLDRFRMSKLSYSEECVTYKGNIRASYLKFRLSDHDGSDHYESETDEDTKTRQSHVSAIKTDFVADLSNQNLSSFNIYDVPNPAAVKYLYLQNNKLSKLPRDLFIKFKNIEWLDIRNNNIKELPYLFSNSRYEIDNLTLIMIKYYFCNSFQWRF